MGSRTRVQVPYSRSSAVAQARAAALQRFDRSTPSNSRLLPALPERLRSTLRLTLRLPQVRSVRIRVRPTRVRISLPFGKRGNSRAVLTTPTRSISRARLMPRKKRPRKSPRAKIEMATPGVRVGIPESPSSLTGCPGPRKDREKVEKAGGVRGAQLPPRTFRRNPSLRLGAKEHGSTETPPRRCPYLLPPERGWSGRPRNI
jgi:hypothetical protein